MYNHDDFIVMGRDPNPNVPDIPLGFGMALMQEAEARNRFEHLNDSQKTRLIHYIKDNATGREAKGKIADVVEQLKHDALNI